MLLKSTGSFLESGLQERCAELWASADDSASDEIRWGPRCLSSALAWATPFRSRRRAQNQPDFSQILLDFVNSGSRRKGICFYVVFSRGLLVMVSRDVFLEGELRIHVAL